VRQPARPTTNEERIKIAKSPQQQSFCGTDSSSRAKNEKLLKDKRTSNCPAKGGGAEIKNQGHMTAVRTKKIKRPLRGLLRYSGGQRKSGRTGNCYSGLKGKEKYKIVRKKSSVEKKTFRNRLRKNKFIPKRGEDEG